MPTVKLVSEIFLKLSRSNGQIQIETFFPIVRGKNNVPLATLISLCICLFRLPTSFKWFVTSCNCCLSASSFCFSSVS